MQYKVLTTEQQIQMVTQRVQALEADHFGHSMNKQGVESLPDADETKAPAIAKIEEMQATIEAAHTVAVAELENLQGQVEA